MTHSGSWPPDFSAAALLLLDNLSSFLSRSSWLAWKSMFGTNPGIPVQTSYLESYPLKEKPWVCLPGLLCHARMSCSCCGFPGIPTITCSFSSNRKKPTRDEQGLPTSAPGCPAVFTAVPPWWDTLLSLFGVGRGRFVWVALVQFQLHYSVGLAHPKMFTS